MTLIRHLMNQFEAGLQKIELVTDHSEDYCRNYGRNIVDYVATLNYLSHSVVVLVLPGKRLSGKTSFRENVRLQTQIRPVRNPGCASRDAKHDVLSYRHVVCNSSSGIGGRFNNSQQLRRHVPSRLYVSDGPATYFSHLCARRAWGTKMCRYNWHSAGSPGWPFPMLNKKYIFQIKYTEAISSNSTR